MKNLKKATLFKFALPTSLALLPFSAFALTFSDLVKNTITPILNTVITLIFSLATLMFVWGVVQYVINEADSAEREKGRSFMIWGIIALFVMMSVYGLVNILDKTFKLDNSQIVMPQIK